LQRCTRQRPIVCASAELPRRHCAPNWKRLFAGAALVRQTTRTPDFDPLEMQMSILCRGIGFLPMEHGLRNQCHFGLSIFAAEEFHDIAPPVDYSLISPWLVFLIAFVVLSLCALAVWFFELGRNPPLPPKLPREIALEELERISRQIKRMSPYQFSIRASDILRRYVTQQYGLLATRQTSIEF